MTEPIETTAVAVREPEPMPVAPPQLWGTADQSAILAKATNTANALKDVVKSRGLISNIQGKEYPRCEAWTLLGTLLGVFPVLCWTKQIENGWEARVEAKTLSGAVVGAAEAQCCRNERNWNNRDDFALRSMAQTRATAKALRMPLGFIMTLAGYQATPAEEMEHEREPQRFPKTKQTTAHAQGVSGSSAPAKPQPGGVASPQTSPGLPLQDTFPPRPQPGDDRAPVVFDEAKLRKNTEAWLDRQKAEWVKANTNPAAWAWMVTAGMIMQNEKMDAVSTFKLFPLQDRIDEVVGLIRTGKQSEASGGRALNVSLLEIKDEIAKLIEATGIGDEERAAFAAVYGHPGTSEEQPQKPPPVQGVPTTCPKCKGTATKTSKDYDLVSWCMKCGHQWTEGGKPFEPHDFMTIPLPYASKEKQALGYVGKTLGQISRIDPKYFFGITENCEYPAQGYKGQAPSAAKSAFAEACKKAREARAKDDKQEAVAEAEFHEPPF